VKLSTFELRKLPIKHLPEQSITMAFEQPVALSGPGSQAQKPTPRCGQRRTSSSCTCTCAFRLPRQSTAYLLERTTVGMARYCGKLYGMLVSLLCCTQECLRNGCLHGVVTSSHHWTL
jgi:hypothetical protein